MSSESAAGEEVILRGIPGAAGVTHGPALVFMQSKLEVPAYQVLPEESEEEIARFEAALLETRRQITRVRQQIAVKLGEAEAQIFDAHQLVLEDKALIEEVIAEQQKSNYNIEHCFHKVAQRYIDFFDTIDDEYLKERVADIRDVTRRLLHVLLGQIDHSIHRLSEGRIIVSEDLSPSETAMMEKDNLLGFITRSGGITSHTVIMARSLQIPAVVGVKEATDRIRSSDDLLIDGYDGLVYINPSDKTLFRYGRLERRMRDLRKRYDSSIGLSTETKDGHPIILRANIDGAYDLPGVEQVKARGVGLFRTEGLFLRDNDFPSEERQYEEYRQVVEAAAPHAVVIRTMDLGGDKHLRGVFDYEEDNPFMGFRAIRFCLQHPDLFKNQLRAILRASAHGQVRILYPMISGVGELLEANALLEEARSELRERGQDFAETVQVGSMIEIPSAVYVAESLAEHCQFFSIGTNDLIQYMLAADRMNDRVAHLYDSSHPAVLRAIKQVIEAARLREVTVSICGEMASDPRYSGLLVGMGAHELSVAVPRLPEINYLIRLINSSDARSLAEKALALHDPVEISALLGKFYAGLMSGIES